MGKLIVEHYICNDPDDGMYTRIECIALAIGWLAYGRPLTQWGSRSIDLDIQHYCIMTPHNICLSGTVLKPLLTLRGSEASIHALCFLRYD